MTTSEAPNPRGIRNHNPGNVRANPAIIWRGQCGIDGDGFLVFNDPVFGVRCLSVVIRHYKEYHGCVQLRDYITRWAPPAENATDAYIEAVAAMMGKQPGDAIDLEADGLALAKAIIIHENGFNPYDDATIAKGIHLSHIQ